MTNQEQSIDVFVDRLIEEKKFENITDEVKNQIRQDLLSRIEDRINATILEHMPPEKMEEFSTLLDHANEKEIQEFCHINIPKLDEIIARTLLDFRDSYLNA